MTMVMKANTVNASHFKASCLALMDQVAETGRPLVVTKRGKPVVRVVPIDEPVSLSGSVRFLVDEAALLAPVEAEWGASRQ